MTKKLMKLSPGMERALRIARKSGCWVEAWKVHVTGQTLNALKRRGLIEVTYRPSIGAFRNPNDSSPTIADMMMWSPVLENWYRVKEKTDV